MTRRGFFRLLGLAAVTAPATAALVPEKLSGVRQWWVPVERWVKEFDRGHSLGVAQAYRNVLTGEKVRNAVRIVMPPMGAEGRSRSVTQAVRLLDAWAADLPAWRSPVRPGHGHYDDVLEGREWMLAPMLAPSGFSGKRVA